MRSRYYKILFNSLGSGIAILGKIKVIKPENIDIGNHASINEGCFLNARDKITIGSYVHISPGVTINTGGLNYLNKIEKIHQSLIPGGVLVGSIPHAFNIQTRLKFLFGTKHLTPLADPTHINYFTADEFRKLLADKFTNIEIIGITTPRYKFTQVVFPYLFAHAPLFKGVKNGKNI